VIVRWGALRTTHGARRRDVRSRSRPRPVRAAMDPAGRDIFTVGVMTRRSEYAVLFTHDRSIDARGNTNTRTLNTSHRASHA
jgi:hypothetical protein